MLSYCLLGWCQWAVIIQTTFTPSHNYNSAMPTTSNIMLTPNTPRLGWTTVYEQHFEVGHNVKVKGLKVKMTLQCTEIPCQVDMPWNYEAVVIYSFRARCQNNLTVHWFHDLLWKYSFWVLAPTRFWQTGRWTDGGGNDNTHPNKIWPRGKNSTGEPTNTTSMPVYIIWVSEYWRISTLLWLPLDIQASHISCIYLRCIPHAAGSMVVLISW